MIDDEPSRSELPYSSAAEAAAILRTTRKAFYALVGRQLIPGVRRVGRRLLVRRSVLLRWVESKRDESATSRR